MKRREFIIQTTQIGLTIPFLANHLSSKTHWITLSFDDGFKKSFYRIAEIHESFGLKACLNVIASGHMPGFKAVDQWILPELMGNFDDWNKLKDRGHEVMPHTWEHLNLTKIPEKQAKENMTKCFDYFEAHLDGYDPTYAVYNFAFNASTPELERFALERVSAVRTAGWVLLKDERSNPLPSTNKSLRLGCWSQGPEYCDTFVEKEIDEFLTSDGGWLILNLHGLDQEGWGPLHPMFLEKLLKKLVEMPQVAVEPAGVFIRTV